MGALKVWDSVAAAWKYVGNVLGVRDEANSQSEPATTDLRFPDGTVYADGSGVVHIKQVPTALVGCIITEATAQSLTNDTPTAMTSNDAEILDTDGFHDTSTNTARMTCPAGKGGVYDVEITLFFAANATGYRQASIYKGGVDQSLQQRSNSVSGSVGTYVTVAAAVPLTPGEYIEAFGSQTSGGALNGTLIRFSAILQGSGVGLGIGCAAVVRRAAVQAVTSGAFSPWTYFSWDTEVLDTHNFWAAGDPTKLVCATAGVYVFGAYWTHNGSSATATDTIILIERYNSSNVLQGVVAQHRYESRHDDAGTCQGASVMAAGDYIKVGIYHTTGSSRNATGSAWIQRIDQVPNNGGAIPSGTAFPTGIQSGTRFRRTDIRGGMDFRYDGTRWLSEQLFMMGDDVYPWGATATHTKRFGHLPRDYDIYVEDVDISTYQSGNTPSSSHNFAFTLQKYLNNNTQGTLGSFVTTSDTISTWTNHDQTINAVVDTGNAATDAFAFTLTATLTGTQTVYWTATWYYRLIAT